MPTDSTPHGQLPLAGMGTKFCVGCGETKPLSDYYVKTSGKPYGRCKPCIYKQIERNRAIRADPILLAEREKAKRDALTGREKTCSRCRRLLPQSAFYPKNNGSGLTTARCRECLDAIRKMYFELHPEKEMERRKKWMEEKRPERLASARRWKAENPERVREYKRLWNAANPQPSRDRANQWAKDNPDKAREQRRTRKARVRGNGGSFSEADWERLKAQYGWRCLACGVQEPEVVLQADHIVPIAMGGWNIISNIQPLCPFHNNSKWKKFIDYRPDPYGLKERNR